MKSWDFGDKSIEWFLNTDSYKLLSYGTLIGVSIIMLRNAFNSKKGTIFLGRSTITSLFNHGIT